MTPAAAIATYKTVRGFPWLRVTALVVAALYAGYVYWVLPVLQGIDKVTPWDGVVPGSCGQTAAPRMGWAALTNDAGRLLHGLTDGPPAPAEMVGWFRTAGRQARVGWASFESGTQGQQLLPLAPLPEPAPALPASGSLSDAQVATLARTVGWPETEVPNVVARVRAESSGDPRARDYADGTHHGLLQLGTAEQARYLEPGASAFDPAANLRGALRLWQERGWQPWAASDSAVTVAPVRPVVGCETDPVVMQAGYSNGALPAHTLVPLSWTPGRLRADAAASLDALNVAYRSAFGTDLAVTDTYRDLAGQHACTRAKGSMCAKPGTSQHGWGVAVDLGGGVQRFGTAQHEWMRAHGPSYGWVLPGWAQQGGSKPEPWHWEHSGADGMSAG